MLPYGQSDSVVSERTDAQRQAMERFNSTEWVDVHCHCLPGLDDGPADMASALQLCRALADDGITTVIATPHQLGSYSDRNDAGRVRQAVDELRQALRDARIPIAVFPGGDVRVDPKVVALLKDDQILTLADGKRYILLELPHDVFINLQPLLVSLARDGIRAIVSHPERHAVLVRQPFHLLPWLEQGALLQVTAGSLLGEFGETSQRAAWDWVGSGLASIVANDAHGAVHRAPRMSEAADAISSHLGHAVARRVCIENPLRVLRGESVGHSVQRFQSSGRR
jgi:protein-tyrosine phosphatase